MPPLWYFLFMQPLQIGVVGSGPAGLIIADLLSKTGLGVSLFEKRASLGRKLLVAGSSGLNITNSLPLDRFISAYEPKTHPWDKVIGLFPPSAWIKFVEELGISTFEGSSHRYFVEDMKAAKLVQAWKERLLKQNVNLQFNQECIKADFVSKTLHFSGGESKSFDLICFALGGGSWEPNENPLRWPQIFLDHGIELAPFKSSNVGFEIDWKPEFVKKCEGQPLKNINLKTSKGSCEGELLITSYGLEGTPVYSIGDSGDASIDFQPHLTHESLVSKLGSSQENFSPIRRISKLLTLSPVALELIFHHSSHGLLENRDLDSLARSIKNFPLHLKSPRPLSEAISSSGGIKLDELNSNYEFKRFPGIYAAGEMLNWDAPTGGYLLQACVAQGYKVARAVLTR